MDPSAASVKSPKQRNAARSAAYRSAAYRARQGESTRIANLPEEKQTAMREKWVRNSAAYRIREAIKQIAKDPPTLEKTAIADAKLPFGFLGNIELDKRYATSQYAFPTNREESIAGQLSRLAQHPTGKRKQHFFMSQSVEKADKTQRTQEGGKKTSSKANAKSKSTQKKK